MNDQQLKQRIAYLIEHGGMLDDPLADMRRGIRIAIGVSSLALLLEVVALFT